MHCKLLVVPRVKYFVLCIVVCGELSYCIILKIRMQQLVVPGCHIFVPFTVEVVNA